MHGPIYFPGKNIGVGCHFLPEILLTQVVKKPTSPVCVSPALQTDSLARSQAFLELVAIGLIFVSMG